MKYTNHNTESIRNFLNEDFIKFCEEGILPGTLTKKARAFVMGVYAFYLNKEYVTERQIHGLIALKEKYSTLMEALEEEGNV